MTVSGACRAAACLTAQSSARSELGEPSTPTTIPGIACSFPLTGHRPAAMSSRTHDRGSGAGRPAGRRVYFSAQGATEVESLSLIGTALTRYLTPVAPIEQRPDSETGPARAPPRERRPARQQRH